MPANNSGVGAYLATVTADMLQAAPLLAGVMLGTVVMLLATVSWP